MTRAPWITGLALALAAFTASAFVAAPRVSAREPAKAASPIQIETQVRKNPAQHFFVAKIDLNDPRVSIVVAPAAPDPDGPGPWETTLRPVSAIARDLNFDLTINTVFFNHQSRENDLKKYAAGELAAGMNLVVIDGKPVTTAMSGALLSFDKKNHATIGMVDGHVPDGVWQGAAGSMQIVTAGKNTAGDDHARHPRTAAGLADDGHTLVLLVADGRRPDWGIGLTLTELADEMLALGCQDAINFDGGGSSTMAARTPDGHVKVLNTPSDGSTFLLPLSIERPVPYVLGVRVAK